MKIVIISWWYPPWNDSASARPYSWALEFARRGHEVEVITCSKDPGLHGDLSMPSEPHPRLEVKQLPTPLRKVKYGKKIVWMTVAAGEVWRAARGADVVVTTFMPWHVQVLGRLAKLANPRVFWCADYRDLWSDYDYYYEGKPLRRKMVRALEKWLVKKADLMTSISPPLVAKLREMLPGVPGETIYNGFLKEHLAPTCPAARLAARKGSGEPFRVLYTGTLYPGYHDPEPLFRALAEGDWGRPVKVYFYGRCAKQPILRELATNYEIEEMIETPERYLGRDECLAMQRDVDLLLHLSWTNPEVDGVLSGKVFEYLAAGTPVLSIGSPPETAIGQLLEESGGGVCVGMDSAAVGQALDAMVNRAEFPAWFHPDHEKMARFSREEQAGRLLEMLLLSPGATARDGKGSSCISGRDPAG